MAKEPKTPIEGFSGCLTLIIGFAAVAFVVCIVLYFLDIPIETAAWISGIFTILGMLAIIGASIINNIRGKGFYYKICNHCKLRIPPNSISCPHCTKEIQYSIKPKDDSTTDKNNIQHSNYQYSKGMKIFLGISLSIIALLFIIDKCTGKIESKELNNNIVRNDDEYIAKFNLIHKSYAKYVDEYHSVNLNVLFDIEEAYSFKHYEDAVFKFLYFAPNNLKKLRQIENKLMDLKNEVPSDLIKDYEKYLALVQEHILITKNSIGLARAVRYDNLYESINNLVIMLDAYEMFVQKQKRVIVEDIFNHRSNSSDTINDNGSNKQILNKSDVIAPSNKSPKGFCKWTDKNGVVNYSKGVNCE